MQIDINGIVHELTSDGFGLYYIDGTVVQEWVKTVDTDTLLFLARKGLDVAQNEPEYLEDIMDRSETPEAEANLMRQFKKGKR